MYFSSSTVFYNSLSTVLFLCFFHRHLCGCFFSFFFLVYRFVFFFFSSKLSLLVREQQLTLTTRQELSRFFSFSLFFAADSVSSGFLCKNAPNCRAQISTKKKTRKRKQREKLCLSCTESRNLLVFFFFTPLFFRVHIIVCNSERCDSAIFFFGVVWLVTAPCVLVN